MNKITIAFQAGRQIIKNLVIDFYTSFKYIYF